MSQDNTNTDQQEEENNPGLTAPAFGAVGGGGYSLMPDVQLPKRTVKNVSKTLGQVDQKDIIPSTTSGNEFIYIGQNLVNSQGVLIRGQYTDDEAYSELAKLPLAERRALQNQLYSVGAYGNSRPSRSGFNSADFSAMREAMLYANSKGVTLDVAVSMMAAELGTGVGGGARIRTTPKQDLQAVFRQASSQILGRRLSDAEVEKFVKAYNRQEVNQAMGGAMAPSVQTAATQAVEAAAPDEAAAMGALRLTNVIDSAIKELG
jgi:hypothetical protein